MRVLQATDLQSGVIAPKTSLSRAMYSVASGERFQVIDSCTRAMLRTSDLEDQGQQLANVFNLKLLENQEDRETNYMLKTSSM